MRLWILTVGEPLPIDPGDPRFLRSGIIAQLAASQGHEVTWFNSTLEHNNKVLRFDRTTKFDMAPNLDVVCLHGGTYKKNVSAARILNHVRIGCAFRRYTRDLPVPDVILCSLPLIELAHEAIRFQARHGTRVVLDVRDYWPDIWADAMPVPLRPIARLLLSPWTLLRNRAIRRANGMIGITDEAVDWACRSAGRAKGKNDFGVPMAYQMKTLTDAQSTEADAFWTVQGLRRDDTVLCFLGTLTARFKPQFMQVIEAMRSLPDTTRAKIKIVMAGSGELLDELRSATHDLPNMIFPGWIDAPKIQRLMAQSRAGLLPYPNTQDFMDSLPNKSIEYLAGSLPIITCLRGRVERLITRDDCGVLYPEGLVPPLMDILASMAEKTDDLDRKRDNARAVYERDFTPEKVYGHLLHYMETL